MLALIPRATSVLTSLRDELRRLITALDRMNRHNAFLLDRAITYVEGLVRALVSATAEPLPLYVATGRTAGTMPSARLLDRRA